MKTILMSFAIVLLLILNLVQYNKYKHSVTIEYHTDTRPQVGDILVLEDIDSNGAIHIVPQEQSNQTTSIIPRLIWNADDEGIPGVNGLIKVEQIDGDKYYLIPADE